MTEDPNVRTDPVTGEQVVLEPGDEGYVEPTTEQQKAEVDTRTEVTAPAPQDLTLQQEHGESDAEFMERQRNTVVVSESPGDIVPNMPQITMGNQEPEPEVEPQAEGEEAAPATTGSKPSAADLIAQAEAATTDEELDEIEAQADGRVTVLDAVEKRRAELTDAQ